MVRVKKGKGKTKGKGRAKAKRPGKKAAPKGPRPVLIITCGLTGTGKSTTMRKVTDMLDMPIEIIASDVVRKELIGLAPDEHRYEPFGKGIYSSDLTERTYTEMFARAASLLQAGWSVVLDACFIKDGQRRLARRTAQEAGASFLCIEFRVPEHIVRDRLGARLQRGAGPSDGRWEIYLGQVKAFDPIKGKTEMEHLVVDGGTGTIDAILGAIIRLSAGPH